MDEITLYSKDARGQLRYWSISVDGIDIDIEHGCVGGEPTIETEEVLEGKGGRTLDEQIMSRVNSRVNKKKDAGYVTDIRDAMENKKTNTLGLAKPMLAAKFEKCMDQIEDGNFALQDKLDGHRDLITKQNGEVIMYSRGGKIVSVLPHIAKEHEDLPEGKTIDGELYCHGMSLQKIGSIVKRKDVHPDAKLIKFRAYDVMSDAVFSIRHQWLSAYIGSDMKHSILHKTLFNIKAAAIPYLLKERRAKGYEGLILRLDKVKIRGKEVAVGYEDGKRSKSLIKVKDWDSDEFLIVDKEYSRKGRPVFWCVTKDGTRFKVTPPGNTWEKRILMNGNPIGRHVSVEFANYTKDGVPFQPIAKYMREIQQE